MISAADVMRTIARADWRRFVGAIALLTFYGGWLHFGDSPFRRARDEIGRLPEFSFGFDLREPATSLERLGAARVDYLWAQAFDIPFAALIALVGIFSCALAAARTRTPVAAARAFLILPLAFLATELGENILLSLFAAELASSAAPLGLVQQALTDLKLALAAIMLFLAASFTAAVDEAPTNRKDP